MADEKITYGTHTQTAAVAVAVAVAIVVAGIEGKESDANKKIKEMDFKRYFMEIKRLFMCTNSAMHVVW